MKKGSREDWDKNIGNQQVKRPKGGAKGDQGRCLGFVG